MALSPDQRRRLLRMNMLMAYASFASSKAVAWTPATLFANAEVGGWYDPSDLTTMFQDAAGTTAAALESPVGLVLDKSKGLVLGSELITVAANRDFSSDTGYWSKSGGVTISGGAAVFSSVGTGLGLYRSGVVAAGKYYEVTFTISSVTAGEIVVYVGGNRSAAASSAGTYTRRVLCGTADTFLYFEASGTTSLLLDNVSLKEVTGNHLSQSTSTARPVLSARVNLLTYSDDFRDTTAAGSTRPWSNYQATVQNSSVAAPDGTLTADVLTPTTANDTHYVRFGGLTTAASLNYTLSVAIKSNGYGFARVQMISPSSPFELFEIDVNLSNGSYTTNASNGGAVTSGSVLDLGNGWYRCTVTGNIGTKTNAAPSIYAENSANNASFTGNGTSGIYIWGADLRPSNAGVGLPSYQRVGASTDYDATGFPYYLRADGADDRLFGPAISNLISASTYEACIGARVLAVSTSSGSPWLNQSLVAEGAGGYATIGYATTSNIIGAYNFDGTVDTVTVSMTPPSTFILQQRHDAGNLVLSLDGGAEASVASGNTSVLTGSLILFSSSNNNYIPAHCYGLVIRSTAFTAAERASIRDWMNSKTKAY